VGTSGTVDMLDFELALDFELTGHFDLDDVSGTTGTWTVEVVAEGCSGTVETMTLELVYPDSEE
jgi:hypothetical protein